jgi:hypothetical protein
LYSLFFKENPMNTRRFLTFLAALLITWGQALLFAADTAASAELVLASVAIPAGAAGGSRPS